MLEVHAECYMHLNIPRSKARAIPKLSSGSFSLYFIKTVYCFLLIFNVSVT